MIRGLEIRIAYSKAKLHLAITNGCDISEDEMAEVWFDAKAMGMSDYRSGQETMPATFHGERMLEAAWHEGVDSAEESFEMSQCPGCNDISGDPCHIHG